VAVLRAEALEQREEVDRQREERRVRKRYRERRVVLGSLPEGTWPEVSVTELTAAWTAKPSLSAKESRKIPDGGVDCVLEFYVPPHGVPTAMRVRACPDGLVSAVHRAAVAWEFEPTERPGPVVAQLVIKFRTRAPSP